MARNGLIFQARPSIVAGAVAVGELESEGPLRSYFDLSSPDSKFGMETWEKAEAEMIRACSVTVLKKAKLKADDVDFSLSGDLTNQCAATTFGLKEHRIPTIGLYGACSTFVLALGMAGALIESGLGECAMVTSSSHFCSAERQYRFPLEYGCQRTPTAQTTVTAAGSVVIKKTSINAGERLPFLSEFFPGRICDKGVHDANNMGAAMAPSCADTLLRYLQAREARVSDFDMIITGDLGAEGHRIFTELCQKEKVDLQEKSTDCGLLIFDRDGQDVGAGGSGCGCSASVFASYFLEEFRAERLHDVLFLGTGALLSPATVLQKETIPAVTHLVRIRKERK